MPADEDVDPVDLAATLDLLARTIVRALGFGVAAVNLARPDGSQEVVAVAGPPEAREALLGNVDGPTLWDEVVARSERWGRLCFLDHSVELPDDEALSWVPDIKVSDDPRAWHPKDALFAPLYAGDGSLLGMLSVDLPHDGRRPDRATQEALEAFAVSAALAIEHATLRSRAEASQRRFQELAQHDPLTALGNRSMLLNRLRHAVGRHTATRSMMALLFMDLDGFKRVNDEFSHAVGDLVLLSVADRLRNVVRLNDTVARWGGDEFIVLLEDLADTDTVLSVTRRINEVVAEPVDYQGHSLRVSGSIGIAIAGPYEDVDADELIRRADRAMYRAKRSGKDRSAVFDPTMADVAVPTHHVSDLLERALDEDRLVLHYQPIVRVPDLAVTGAEALLRLRDDDGSLLYPAGFLPAEEQGLMRRIEYEVLRRACEQAARWRGAGHQLRVAVNLGVARLAAMEELESVVRGVLEETGLPPSGLTCELTERGALDVTPDTLLGMTRLVETGVDVSVDDFAASYGSLLYLRSMPVQEVKIDRSIVEAAPSDRSAAAIVRSVVALAAELEVRCVAEGVETAEQHALIRDLGVGLAQGHWYGRPVPPAELTAALGG